MQPEAEISRSHVTFESVLTPFKDMCVGSNTKLQESPPSPSSHTVQPISTTSPQTSPLFAQPSRQDDAVLRIRKHHAQLLLPPNHAPRKANRSFHPSLHYVLPSPLKTYTFHQQPDSVVTVWDKFLGLACVIYSCLIWIAKDREVKSSHPSFFAKRKADIGVLKRDRLRDGAPGAVGGAGRG
jgi:hypothetical protein